MWIAKGVVFVNHVKYELISDFKDSHTSEEQSQASLHRPATPVGITMMAEVAPFFTMLNSAPIIWE
jgi:hypothetical protein